MAPKSLQHPPSRSSNYHDTSKEATSDGGIEEIPNRVISPEKGVEHADDTSGSVKAAPTLGIIQSTAPKPLEALVDHSKPHSPPKPLEALIDNLKPHSFFYLDGCSTRPWDDRSGTPSVIRIPPGHKPGSSGSSSPDDAAPPPISRHRRQIAPATKKHDRLNIWTKPARTDRNPRVTPHTIRDLTPEVTPWEECDAAPSEQNSHMRCEESKRKPDALPWESSVKFGAAAASEVKVDAAASKKSSPRRKISRFRDRRGHEEDKKVGSEKRVPRDEKGVGMKGRMSRLLSDSDEDFLAEFESDGYFLR